MKTLERNTKCLENRRFLIGHLGLTAPLVVIGMNPSSVSNQTSVPTANRIIKASQLLGFDGWVIANVYPERATKPWNVGEFDEELSKLNCKIIVDFLKENFISEVWGAWGDLHSDALNKGKNMLLSELKRQGIRVCYFSHLTRAGNPAHPQNRQAKFDFTLEGKKYLDY